MSSVLLSSQIQTRSEVGGRLVILAAFCGVMVGFGSLMVFTFGVFLKPLSHEFSWSREAVSRAFGFAAMSVAVCSPTLGQWLDRYGPRAVILPCMTVYGLAVASLGLLTPQIWHLYAVFVVIGIVGNATTQMGYSRAVSSWFSQSRGFALALVMAGVGVGAIVFPALAQRLIEGYGWRTAYFTLGGIILVCGLPMTALFVRECPGVAGTGSPTAEGASVREGLRSRAFWFLVAMLFLSSISINGAITHLSPLLTDRGLSAERAALAVSVLGGSSFCGRLVTGYLLDRFFGPRVAFVLMSGVALGILLLATAAASGQALLAGALIGFGLGAEADITPYLLSRYFGLRTFSTLYGFTWTAYALAGAAGPVIMGKAFDLTGSYGPLLTLLSGVTLIAGALMLFLPRYPERSAT